MKIEKFIKPTVAKIFLVIIIFIIMFFISLIFGTEATIDYYKANLVDYITGIHYLRANLLYIPLIFLYYYILSCLIVFVYNKLKNT